MGHLLATVATVYKIYYKSLVSVIILPSDAWRPARIVAQTGVIFKVRFATK